MVPLDEIAPFLVHPPAAHNHDLIAEVDTSGVVLYRKSYKRVKPCKSTDLTLRHAHLCHGFITSLLTAFGRWVDEERKSRRSSHPAGVQFVREGADILDLGAKAPARRRAMDAQVELERLLPALQSITALHLNALISIDPYKPQSPRSV